MIGKVRNIRVRPGMAGKSGVNVGNVGVIGEVRNIRVRPEMARKRRVNVRNIGARSLSDGKGLSETGKGWKLRSNAGAKKRTME